MLIENGLAKYYWVEAVSQQILKKTPYELFRGRNPNISYLRPLGCKCFSQKNRKDNLGKFDARSDEEIFLGYSLNGKAYRVLNISTNIVEEIIHVVFDEIDVLH